MVTSRISPIVRLGSTDGTPTKVAGRHGTARWLNLTVTGSRPDTVPGTDWSSLHEPFGDIPEANTLGNQIETDADGNFAVYAGGEKGPTNWLPTAAGTRRLVIRAAFDAWFES